MLDPLIVDRSDRARLRFFVIGDFGSGDRWQAKVADAMAIVAEREPPDFVLSTGDCLYTLDDAGDIGAVSVETALAERFDPYYARLGVDFFQCLGNHELTDVFACDTSHMIAHTRKSPIWRMPGESYAIAGLPPWLAIHVANTNVFGFGGLYAEGTLYSPEQMDRELEALAATFADATGLKILVGHHPVFTPGKRTHRYNGDGEVLYMRPLREAIEACGVHLYLAGHEHHQSHTSGPGCEYVVQGCGGVGFRPNPKHARRESGWRDIEKLFHFVEVMNGFCVIDVTASHDVRLRFFGIPFDEPARAAGVIYERRWSGLEEIGDRRLWPVLWTLVSAP